MRFLVRKLDNIIRKSIRVFEFNGEADTLLRLQFSRAPHALHLPDGVVKAGEPVLLIHLWNERMPPLPPDGPDLAWARRFLRRFEHSLRLTAGYLQETDPLNTMRAVGGMTILLTAGLHESGSRFMQDMGFTTLPYSSQLGRFGEFWENFYSWLIIWTFNPSRLPHRSLFRLRRSEIWMGRQAFMERYG
jgi:hypothetical protein